MNHTMLILFLLAAGCGPKLPADRRYARDVAVAVDEGDERCAASRESDDVIERCKRLRASLKPILLEADRDAGAP